MKNRPFSARFQYALNGIVIAWQGESSFRTQVILATGALVFLCVLRPEAVWWAIFLLAIGGVLGAELLNTALEAVIDRLHPETHPMIARAKDCAAGAVLVMSLISIGVAVAILYQEFAAKA